MSRVMLCSVVLAFLVAGACGGDEADAEFTLRSSPEFVNRIIPGHRPVGLVALAEGDGPIELSAVTSLPGGSVTLIPTNIDGSTVSEVWIEVPGVVGDVPFTVTVTGRRGSAESGVTLSATAVPGVDDLEPTALDIAGYLLERMRPGVPELPDVDDLTGGTPIAGLLVVSHYAWFTDEFEVALKWHIMIAPDDFAELYVRPRDELRPIRAFRVNSWSTALQGGEVTVTEVPPPEEVSR